MLFIYLLVGAIGLALGSFGNVLVLRILSKESIGGRSYCPHCKRTLRASDLIPVVSYLWLSGKCRGCKKSISVQYPLVELGSMAVFLFAFSLHPTDILLASLTGIALFILLLSCVYDMLRQELPDAFTIALAVVSAVIVLLAGDISSSLLGACIPLLWLGGQWLITRGTSVGSGDIFLATVIGFWLGLRGAVVMMIGSYMVGAVIILALFAVGKLHRKQKRIAFAPFIGLSTLLTLAGFGDAYLRISFGL